MEFPNESKEDQYRVLGHILASTARHLGAPICNNIEMSWADSMARLAAADDASEENPESFDCTALLKYLQLDSSNKKLRSSADGLLVANANSIRASSVSSHFQSRAGEARHSSDLLRYQSPECISKNEKLWRQMGQISVVGIHFDSLYDTREDAHRLPQFSARELGTGALAHFIRETKGVSPRAWVSLTRAMHEHGLDAYMVRKTSGVFKSALKTSFVSEKGPEYSAT